MSLDTVQVSFTDDELIDHVRQLFDEHGAKMSRNMVMRTARVSAKRATRAIDHVVNSVTTVVKPSSREFTKPATTTGRRTGKSSRTAAPASSREFTKPSSREFTTKTRELGPVRSASSREFTEVNSRELADELTTTASSDVANVNDQVESTIVRSAEEMSNTDDLNSTPAKDTTNTTDVNSRDVCTNPSVNSRDINGHHVRVNSFDDRVSDALGLVNSRELTNADTREFTPSTSVNSRELDQTHVVSSREFTRLNVKPSSREFTGVSSRHDSPSSREFTNDVHESSPERVHESSRTTHRKQMASWPIIGLALPAFVAIWGGWVGLGKLTGFGKVNLLPGIGKGWVLDTAITLPVSVEVYAAFALHAWLSPAASRRTRIFAAASGIGSLITGAGGQIAYHLLTTHDAKTAPMIVTIIVSCLPVAVLGMASALWRMIRMDGEAMS